MNPIHCLLSCLHEAWRSIRSGRASGAAALTRLRRSLLNGSVLLLAWAVAACGAAASVVTPAPARTTLPAATSMPENTPTSTPAPAPVCPRAGTTTLDKVLFPESGELHSFMVYLPPCYAENRDSSYPVLYWTSAGGQGIFEPVDALIHQGDVPATIIISVDIAPDKGYGADAQIVNDVVPYVDAHYHTRADRLHRSITGFSHGAAIAARTAFRAPALFGRVAVLSGGIAEGEQEKFTGWIAAMPPDLRPGVLIDVGEQDGVIVLTRHLTDLLDQLKFPYTFLLDPGSHHAQVADSHFNDYLKWLMPAQ
jgi:enterochelin esterase-like enzyme